MRTIACALLVALFHETTSIKCLKGQAGPNGDTWWYNDWEVRDCLVEKVSCRYSVCPPGGTSGNRDYANCNTRGFADWNCAVNYTTTPAWRFVKSSSCYNYCCATDGCNNNFATHQHALSSLRKEFPTTSSPTNSPTPPTLSPTNSPTTSPTVSPTNSPTISPTLSPTIQPTDAPTVFPTEIPTVQPTDSPTSSPTVQPTDFPTEIPTTSPTPHPTFIIYRCDDDQPNTDCIVNWSNVNSKTIVCPSNFSCFISLKGCKDIEIKDFASNRAIVNNKRRLTENSLKINIELESVSKINITINDKLKAMKLTIKSGNQMSSQVNVDAIYTESSEFYIEGNSLISDGSTFKCSKSGYCAIKVKNKETSSSSLLHGLKIIDEPGNTVDIQCINKDQKHDALGNCFGADIKVPVGLDMDRSYTQNIASELVSMPILKKWIEYPPKKPQLQRYIEYVNLLSAQLKNWADVDTSFLAKYQKSNLETKKNV